jgi:hypothetical protein
MKYYCERVFIPNFNKICCLKHFEDLYYLTEQQQMYSSFSKLIEKTLQTIVSSFSNIPVFKAKHFYKLILKIANDYIVYFYNNCEYTSSKHIFSVIYDANLNEHEDLDIINLKSSINCNIASVYEKENNNQKAREYYELAHYYSKGIFNSLTIQNNLTRIYSKLRMNDYAIETNFSVYVCILELLEKEIPETKDKELICFIFFNCCLFMKKNFERGLQISTFLLGEDHYLTQKFTLKVSSSTINTSNNKNSNSSSMNKKQGKQVNEKYLYPKSLVNDKLKTSHSKKKKERSNSKYAKLNNNIKELLETLKSFSNKITSNKLEETTEYDKAKFIEEEDVSEKYKNTNDFEDDCKHSNIKESNTKNAKTKYNNKSKSNKSKLNRSTNPSLLDKRPTFFQNLHKMKGRNNTVIHTFVNKTYNELTENMIYKMTKEFDEEFLEKNITFPEKKNKNNNKRLNNSTFVAQPRRVLKDFFLKAMPSEKQNKINEKSMNTSKLGSLFEVLASSSKNSTFNDKAEKTDKIDNKEKSELERVETQDKKKKNKLDDKDKEKDKEKSAIVKIGTVEMPVVRESQTNDPLTSLNSFNKNLSKKDLKEISMKKLSYDPTVEIELANKTFGFQIIIDECQEEEYKQAQTYYDKDVKKSVKTKAVKYFKFYLKSIFYIPLSTSFSSTSVSEVKLSSSQSQSTSTITTLSTLCNFCNSGINNNTNNNSNQVSTNSNFESFMKTLFYEKPFKLESLHKIYRIFENKTYEIELSIQKDTHEVNINAIFLDDGKVRIGRTISFQKLFLILTSKISQNQAIPNYYNYNFYGNLNSFISKYIMYHIFLQKKNGALSLAISPQILGSIWHKIGYNFLSSPGLYFDIFIHEKPRGRLIIYNIEE